MNINQLTTSLSTIFGGSVAADGDKIIMGDWLVKCSLTGKIMVEGTAPHNLHAVQIVGTMSDSPNLVASRVRGFVRFSDS